MKKSLLISVSFLVTCFLTSCGINAPLEKDLANMIPKEVLTYTLDGVSYTSSVSNFEVARQQTNEKDCVADCVITMEDENLIRTAYITMYLNYWDKGGWQVDDWEANSTEDYVVVSEYSTERFLDAIMAKGFQREGIQEIEVERNDLKHVVATYSVNQEYMNINAFGDIIAESYLNYSDSYPQEYAWSTFIDTSEMMYQWDIRGDWYIDLKYEVSSQNVESYITITDMVENITSDTNEPFYHISGEATTYYKGETHDEIFDRWDWAWIKGTEFSDMHLLFELDYGAGGFYGSAPLYIRFFPEHACVNKTLSPAGHLGKTRPTEVDEIFPITKLNS